MNDTMRNFVKGLFAGLVSEGAMPSKQTPIAYLYNGVVTPKLSEWDREMYPWLVVVQELMRVSYCPYVLYCFSEKPTTYLSNGVYYLSVPTGTSYIGFIKRTKGWEEDEDGDLHGASIIQVTNSTLSNIGDCSFVWANFDVNDENGEVLVAASDPMPLYDLDVREMSYGVYYETTVTHYCEYNRMKAAALPSWDKSKFPYAVMFLYSLASFSLYLSTTPFRYIDGSPDEAHDGTLVSVNNGCVTGYSCGDGLTWTVDNTRAGLVWANKSFCSDTTLNAFFWSNHDILNEDGSVFLAASEPVPVYE